MDLIDIGASLDWISPIAAIVQDLANGGGHTFLIPDDCGWSGREVANLLKRKGVKSWGHMIVAGDIMLTVKRSHARFAQHVLETAGIPVEGGAPAARRKHDSGWWFFS